MYGKERREEGRRGKSSDWFVIYGLLVHLKPALPIFLMLSFDLSISNAFKSFTVCAVAVSSGGSARVTLHQGKHAALMTTCITPPWCHYNSAPLKLELLGTLTTQQPPTFQLCVRQFKNSVFSRLPKQSIFPSDIREVNLKSFEHLPHPVTQPCAHTGSDFSAPTCFQTHAIKRVNMS